MKVIFQKMKTMFGAFCIYLHPSERNTQFRSKMPNDENLNKGSFFTLNYTELPQPHMTQIID
jgi:hypothetical protein